MVAPSETVLLERVPRFSNDTVSSPLSCTSPSAIPVSTALRPLTTAAASLRERLASLLSKNGPGTLILDQLADVPEMLLEASGEVPKGIYRLPKNSEALLERVLDRIAQQTPGIFDQFKQVGISPKIVCEIIDGTDSLGITFAGRPENHPGHAVYYFSSDSMTLHERQPTREQVVDLLINFGDLPDVLHSVFHEQIHRIQVATINDPVHIGRGFFSPKRVATEASSLELGRTVISLALAGELGVVQMFGGLVSAAGVFGRSTFAFFSRSKESLVRWEAQAFVTERVATMRGFTRDTLNEVSPDGRNAHKAIFAVKEICAHIGHYKYVGEARRQETAWCVDAVLTCVLLGQPPISVASAIHNGKYSLDAGGHSALQTLVNKSFEPFGVIPGSVEAQDLLAAIAVCRAAETLRDRYRVRLLVREEILSAGGKVEEY